MNVELTFVSLGNARILTMRKSFVFCLTALCIITDFVEAQRRPAEGHEPLWTAWGTWSDCSFPCGPGVRTRERACVTVDQDGRTLRLRDHTVCMGPLKMYKTCNEGSCGPHGQEAHAVQCSQHDDDLIYGHRFQWEPLFGGPNVCTLTCLASGTSFYYNFGYVRDGTQCEQDSDEMCVSGQCLGVGCDDIVGSRAVVDNCGVCGGENRACKRYSYTFTAEYPPDGRYGYKKMMKIPSGAVQINITENSTNFLALATEESRYIVNGDWTIDWPGDYPVAGTTLLYQRQEQAETFTIGGPTTDDIFIILMFRQRNPGVFFEFYIPENQLDGLHLYMLNPTTTVPTTTSTTTSTTQSTSSTTTATLPTTERPRSTNRYSTRPDGSIDPDLVRKWYEAYLQRQSDGNVFQRSSSTVGNRVTQIEDTYHRFHHGGSGGDHPRVVQVHVSTKRTYGNTEVSQRRRFGEGNNQQRTTLAPVPVTSRPIVNPFGFKRPSWCGACKPVRQLNRHFCNSDFVSKIRVVDFVYVGNETRYVLDFLHNYHSVVHLLSQEFVWVTNRCRCPKLRINREFIVSGNLVNSNQREARLEMSEDSYAKLFTSRMERKLNGLNKNTTCHSNG